MGSSIPLVYNLLRNGFPLGSPIPLVYNIKPMGLLVFLVYNMNNRSMSSMIKWHILKKIVSIWKSPIANHGHSWCNFALWQQLSQCLNQFPWVHQFLLVYSLLGNGCPLGSPIRLVYNIKPLCLLVLLVYNMNNRSISSMVKCHIQTNIVSTWKSPMASHGHSWSNVALWQQFSECLNQFPWVH